MKVTDSYQLACTPQDYKKCHQLLRGNPEQGDDRELGFPTIMAIRDGQVIGVMSTADMNRTRRIVVNTLRIDKSISNPVFVIKRMIEAYELVLLRAGCKWYWAYVTKENQRLVFLMRRVLGLPLHEDDGNFWFKKEIA